MKTSKLWLLPPALACIAADWPDLTHPSPKTGGGEKDTAIIVGNEDYAFLPDVEGARANAEAWYLWFTKTRGVPAGRVRLLRDSEGTDVGIREALSSIKGQVEPGGTVWFVYIGHGAPAPDGRDGLLIGADAQQTAQGVSTRSVPRGEVVATLDALGQRSVVILDTCFSGRTGSGQVLVPGLQPAVPMWATPPGKSTVLSAAHGDQFAGPLPGLDRPAFSYLVLGALRGWGDGDSNGQVTAQEALEYSRDVLFATVRDRRQVPEMEGAGTSSLSVGAEVGPDIGALVLSAGSSQRPTPTPAPTMERAVLERTRTEIQVRGGLSFGGREDPEEQASDLLIKRESLLAARVTWHHSQLDRFDLAASLGMGAGLLRVADGGDISDTVQGWIDLVEGLHIPLEQGPRRHLLPTSRIAVTPSIGIGAFYPDYPEVVLLGRLDLQVYILVVAVGAGLGSETGLQPDLSIGLRFGL